MESSESEDEWSKPAESSFDTTAKKGTLISKHGKSHTLLVNPGSALFLLKLHVGDTSASCKWRDAQRAMRNRQFIGYTLGPLERNERAWLFDSGGGGGGAVKFCLGR